MIRRLLIANRGEIAIRVMRSAALMGISTVAVHPADDAGSLHAARADQATEIPGVGGAAYLDIPALIAAARHSGCDAVHPGYGFLSESAAFATACAEAGLIFVGPSPETLARLGDKTAGRMAAQASGIPVLAGSDGAVTVEQALAAFDRLPPGGQLMVKALAGGGGRGMRPVGDRAALADTIARCASEAQASFGSGDIYVEQFLPDARHIEVQIVADGAGGVTHLWERECSLQRQRQKVIEIAPAPFLPPATRDRLLEAAVTLGRATAYRGVGTIEFLVDRDGTDFYFIEANARLQVEHTVTEAVTGLDLVALQLAIADGAPLDECGLGAIPAPRGLAIQARVNTEQMGEDGTPRAATGTITRYEPPAGPGVRVDGYGRSGYTVSPRFDSLLAKVIVHLPSGDWATALRATDRALAEFAIDGVATNIGFLRAVLADDQVVAGELRTTLVGEHIDALRAAAHVLEPVHLASAPTAEQAGQTVVPPGHVALTAPLSGVLTSAQVSPGDVVRAGQTIAIVEAMKLEHVVTADVGGTIAAILPAIGTVLAEGAAIALIVPDDAAGEVLAEATLPDPDHIRPDLAQFLERRALTLDAARPDAVAKRHKFGYRTARENIADLADDGSFVEYGSLVIAGQRLRRSVDELIVTTPADGMVTGIGCINRAQFGAEASRCIIMSYDYTVFAGTQGMKNHEKTDRMYELAEQWRLPVILFAESGGGRPGDTDRPAGGGVFNTRAFGLQGKISGLVPQIGIANGRCFAGAAVLLGCCDVVIATEGSTLGVGGPAMIEGGGLGIYTPEEVGPIAVQSANGVVDIVAKDEADAVRFAKRYLSYFQGRIDDWTCADQRLLRHMVPENRLRAYDVRKVIETLCDTGSVLELRQQFGRAAITALARIEGRPVGVIANNSAHLGGAVDSDAADKCSRFMQLCDAYDVPIVVLADTPGNMVGPDAEKTGLIRHCCRMFVTGPNLTVPVFSIVLRKAYGLGVMAMVGGHSQASFFTLSWPTGEFGGMGLEGAIKLGYRKEMEAITDPVERDAWYKRRVAELYENGKALSVAMGFDFDDVIDPADTRARIVAGLESTPLPPRSGKKRPFIDTW
ncbi:carboxyl transferase domain-containing protein [Sphingomonas sp.]|uniref:carboxyl transferase domain-containing protein n=1 Tax=Sphingomonas sp. TaxID=28214 RepID=UPI002CBE95F5|nr:carboxyl transferase domain-containing protein [Sphingomonas sp.]HWK35914.1 carboxyl transferase domain-containing protein [Sphingomonas sp.]